MRFSVDRYTTFDINSQTNRYLDELLNGYNSEKMSEGVPLTINKLPETNEVPPAGKLYFQTENLPDELPLLPGHKPDNTIIAIAYTLQQQHPQITVTLVSKDINMRIKATAIGVHAEDYYNDRITTDTNIVYRGTFEINDDFWQQHDKEMKSWSENGCMFYKICGPDVEKWYPSNFIYHQDGSFEAIVRENDGQSATLEIITDHRTDKNTVWGLKALNTEQNFALNLLMDPKIDFVSLQGSAGSGKTLLALAAGLTQVLEHKKYLEIIMTRVTVPVGEDIGFLPGTEEEKMTPWMGALMDNLEVLNGCEYDGDWERQATNDLIRNRIKVRSLNFMRGRTFLKRYIIIDEAQNLTPKQVKTLITRAGPGTKIICLGDIGQIDTPYLTENSSGLSYVIERFKKWQHSGHITLRRSERSRLADQATRIL